MESLLKKIKIIFILFFILGTVIFYFTLKEFHQEKANQLIEENVLMFDSMQEFIANYQKPAVYKLMNDKNLSQDYFDPTLLSSTYIISHIYEVFKENYAKKHSDSRKNIELRFPSNNPTNPINQATPFEAEVLKKFNNSDIKSYKEIVTHNGKETLFFALPVARNNELCLQCHGDPSKAPKDMIKIYGDKNGFNEKLGEIRAIDAIYSPIDSDNEMIKFFILIEAMMLVVFFGIYFTVKYFVLQLSDKDKFIAKQSKFAAMGEMISMIAHQWRQPLTGMSMTTNNMLLDIELQDIDEKRFQDNLETINKQIAYLSETIDDFKNFFKPNMKMEEVGVAYLVKDTCMIIDSTLKSNGVEIKNSIDENIKLFTQKNDVKQIILNLVKNSMDAYVEKKIENRVIEISAVDKPKRVEIVVKDYAGGIPKEIIEKIFDPYFSTKDKKNGTGLGLYMSKMIVEEHLCGYLDVKVEGVSTIFTISLIKKENEDGN